MPHQISLGGQQEVRQLQIPVNNSVGMEVLQAVQELEHDPPRLWFRQRRPPLLEVSVQLATRAKLHN